MHLPKFPPRNRFRDSNESERQRIEMTRNHFLLFPSFAIFPSVPDVLGDIYLLGWRYYNPP